MHTLTPNNEYPDINSFFSQYRESWHADPYSYYRFLLEEDILPYDADRDMPIAIKYEDVQYVLKNLNFSSRKYHHGTESTCPRTFQPVETPIDHLVSHWMLLHDPPTHTRLRGLTSHAFTPRMLEGITPRISQIADELIRDLQDESRPELLTRFAFPLSVLVITDMLGVPSEDRNLFKAWANTLTGLLDIVDMTPELAVQTNQTANEISIYFKDLIQERRKKPKEDIISTLLAARDNSGALSEEELISNCALLLVAGHETTVNLIGNGMLTLFRHPEAMELLRKEPTRMASAVEEILRFESPVQATTRFVTKEMELRGRQLHPGQEVLVVLAGANRDPAVFKDPNRFDITRSPNRHLAFSSGIHFCLGAPLARKEGEIGISALLRELPNIRLAEESISWRPNITFRGLQSLHIQN